MRIEDVQAWMERALCKEYPAEWFVPVNDIPKLVNINTKKAKKVCDECLVKEECRNYGLTLSVNEIGIYGGLTQNERRAIKKDRTAEGLKTPTGIVLGK